MRLPSILSGAAFSFGAVGLLTVVSLSELAGKDTPKPPVKPGIQTTDKSVLKTNEKPSAKALDKSETTKVDTTSTDTKSTTPSVTAKQSADEVAVRQTGESFVKAYDAADAKAVAAHFTDDAEYVDELGNVFQGRQAIEDSLATFFTENPDCKLEMNIDSIRFISPGVAVEDGTTTITRKEGSDSFDSLYTAVHVKIDGNWLSASVRDHSPKNRRLHRSQLEQLGWLVGDWVDEGDDSIVIFSCKLVDHGNFLLRTFTIQVAGQEAMSGTQRIGFDPLTGKLRTWIFDSEGGYAEGTWHSDGDNWMLKSTGVTADGQPASSTSIYTFVNEHTMTWQSVDHEIAGVQQSDSEVVTIVRQAPSPVPEIAADR